VRSSPIVGEIVVRRQQQTAISTAELARFANQLVEQKGFDYQFDVCDIVPGRKFTAPTKKVRLPLTLTDGKKLSFNVEVESNEESFCGECFSYLPSRQVLKIEMLLIANGKQYRVRRPASLQLDEAFLVDATMKTVLRTWQVPFQTVPIGISPDGKKLYVGLWVGLVDELVLELSEDGGLVFRDRAEIHLEKEPNWIDNFPKDPSNDYLSFVRFQVGDKSYIVRFTAPCT
jgi:hypothetical protein